MKSGMQVNGSVSFEEAEVTIDMMRVKENGIV